MYNFEKYVTEMEQSSVCIDLTLNQVLPQEANWDKDECVGSL